MERVSGSQKSPVGVLEVHVNLTGVYDQLLRRAATILLTNTINTLIVTIIIITIYQSLVGKHLSQLAAFAKSYNPKDPAANVELQRNRIWDDNLDSDELAQLASGINQLTASNRLYIQELKDANREQADFSYAISHDLKSPAVSAGMLLDEVRAQCGETLDPDSAQLLAKARQTLDRMAKQVDAVLEYSRSVAATVEFEPVNLSTLVHDAADDLHGQTQSIGARIDIGELPLVLGSSQLLTSLFQNLLSNALKFRAKDRPLQITIGSVPTADGDLVCVAIADNGIGIDPKNCDRIFGLFKRLHLQRDYPGAGIGLALCQRIVSKHGGSIEVESELGRGTVFNVTLRKAI